MGSYVVFTQTNNSIYDTEAFEAPQTPGGQFTNISTDYISSNAPGGLNSIIDRVGGAATAGGPQRRRSLCLFLRLGLFGTKVGRRGLRHFAIATG
jgi:hypothetical protein